MDDRPNAGASKRAWIEYARHLEDKVRGLEASLTDLRVVSSIRITAGHNDTCASRLVPGMSCSCGHDSLSKILEDSSDE